MSKFTLKFTMISAEPEKEHMELEVRLAFYDVIHFSYPVKALMTSSVAKNASGP